MTTRYRVKSPKKLIEVALPLDAINLEAAREKSIRHGHPSTLHLWWARRPLAAARAVLFAQLVNDPGYQRGSGFRYGKNKKDASIERERLFRILEDLVLWENTTNEDVLDRARAEIRRSWREVCELNADHPDADRLFNPEKMPPLHDPFAGGGAIPLEAQRLGLEACASDLNPVAVLINKAMIEIPPRFAGRAPVGPIRDEGDGLLGVADQWPDAVGLAEDVRRYASWIRDEAEKRIGHFYPAVEISPEMVRTREDLKPLVGRKLTPIAWLWARTVKSPNPAFSHVDVPLVSSFLLCSKEGKDAYIQPTIDGDHYRFVVVVGTPPPNAANGTKANGRGANFRCILSDAPISGDYIKAEGQAGRMGATLMAIVADSPTGRIYLDPTTAMEAVARNAVPTWKPRGDIPARLTGGTCVPYGLTEWGHLFTSRQALALTTLSDLVAEARDRVRMDAIAAGSADDGQRLEAMGSGAMAYAEAISVYLAFCLDKNTLTNVTLATWQKNPDRLTQAFSRQSIPMTWDFAEANPLSDAGGGFRMTADAIAKVLLRLPSHGQPGTACQHDAATVEFQDGIISTDPPYYDNIAYADLSDYFYVWLRKNLRDVYPAMFATLATPKAQELVASAYRHGGRDEAEAFFLEGMTGALRRLARQAHPCIPLAIYYAFKQSETDAAAGTSSTGWAAFLEAVHRAGLQVGGTWPMRTELTANLKKEINSLASSVILVCRPRPEDAPTISRREFLRELNSVLPEALDEMTRGSGGERSPIAPVDLSQAIIGPGMAVFSKYSAVLEADGSSMAVKTALQLINRFLAEDDFDHDTQFCLHWFEQHGWNEGRFGDADTLARAKGTGVEGVKQSGVLFAAGGLVRLLKWLDYPADWEPATDPRLPMWEALHQLIRVFSSDGESGAGILLAAILDKGEAIRQLAYRLYTLCERSGWADDARAYNEIITSWGGIESAAAAVPMPKQPTLFG